MYYVSYNVCDNNYILLQDDELYVAVWNQHVFEIKILLNKGANPNKKHARVSYHIRTQ